MVAEQGRALWLGFVTNSLLPFPKDASYFLCGWHSLRLTFEDFSSVYLARVISPVHFWSLQNWTPFSNQESHL